MSKAGDLQALRQTKIEWRVWLFAAVAAVAVFSPPLALAVGPIVALIALLTARSFFRALDRQAFAAGGLAVFAALSMLWSVDVRLTMIAAASLASVAFTFIGIRHLAVTLDHIRTIALGYLVGCVVLILRVGVLLINRGGLSEFRLSLPDVNANYAGYALVLGLALLPLFWNRHRIAALVAAAILIAGILLAGTRSALIGAVLMLLWIGATRIAKTPPIKTLIALAIAAAVIITTGIADQASLLIESMLGRPTGDWSGRLELWPLAREAWLANPIVGSGASTFQASNPYGVGAHSLFLEIGVGMGIIGVVLFIAVLWSSLRWADPFIAGCFITVTAASYLTGHWEAAPAAWVALAIVSVSAGYGRSKVPLNSM